MTRHFLSASTQRANRRVGQRFSSPLGRQRGLVTTVVLLFLISTVVFALGLMLVNSGNAVVDGERQADSTAAFFLAESGLDKAQADIIAGIAGSFNNSTCTGLGGSYNLGRGTVTLSAVSEPPTCDNSGTPVCSRCTVTATGQVSQATRTLTQDIGLTVRNGTYCNGSSSDCSNCQGTASTSCTPRNPPQWQLKLRNGSGYAGVGVFALTYIEQGATRAACAASSNCVLEVDLTSPSGGRGAVGAMTNAVTIQNGETYPIFQVMSRTDRNVAQVGAFFLGSTAAPTLTGSASTPGSSSYWNNRNADHDARTVGTNTEVTGATNDGTDSSVATACNTPNAGNNSIQTCTTWCMGGDTLVFSYSAYVTNLSDQLSRVTFGTNGSMGQNIVMRLAAKYPTSGITASPPPPTNVDAEIWYARNPNFSGGTTGVNAWSFKGKGSYGQVGAQWSSDNVTSVNGDVLTVGTSLPAGVYIYPDSVAGAGLGDILSSSGGPGSGAAAVNVDCTGGCPRIVSQSPGGTTGRNGTYKLSRSITNVQSHNSRNWTIDSKVLRVVTCDLCNFEAGDPYGFSSGAASVGTLQGQLSLSSSYGLSPEAIGGLGRYVMSVAAGRRAAGSLVLAAPTAGTFGATPTLGTRVYLPSSSNAPAAASLPMRIAVKSAASTGQLAYPSAASQTPLATAGTTVTAVATENATTVLTLGAAPTTRLEGATLCGGTCAMFVPGGTTNYLIEGMTSNFDGWSGGFVCLKGVDVAPQIVTSSTAATGRWTEPVQ